MYPVLFKIGPLEFHSYVVMLSLAFLLGVFLFFRRNERREHPFPVTPMGALWIFLGILLGSKIYYVIEYGDWSQVAGIWRVWEGGLVSLGGIIGGMTAGIIYIWWAGAPVRAVADMALLNVPLCHAVGRIGCFLNGCCYGAPTSMPWGLHYPPPPADVTPVPANTHDYLLYEHVEAGLVEADAAHPLAVHPTPIYSAIGLVLVFAVLLYCYPRRRFDGAFLILYPGLYGAMRFVVEFFRGDTPDVMGGFSRTQLVCLALAVAAAVVYPAMAYAVQSNKNAQMPPGVDSGPGEC